MIKGKDNVNVVITGVRCGTLAGIERTSLNENAAKPITLSLIHI